MGAGEGCGCAQPRLLSTAPPPAPQAMTEKRTKVQTPVCMAVRPAPTERAIAPKGDSLGRGESTPPPKEQGGAASTPPPKEQGTETPAAGTPLITTVMSALPKDQAKAIQGQLERLGVTLQSSPRKHDDRGNPESKPLPAPRHLLRGRQGQHIGGPRRRGGQPASAGRMQPMVVGQVVAGGKSPKQGQERQQMMAVLTGAGLKVSYSLRHCVCVHMCINHSLSSGWSPPPPSPLMLQPNSCTATSQRSRCAAAHVRTCTCAMLPLSLLLECRPSCPVPRRYTTSS